MLFIVEKKQVEKQSRSLLAISNRKEGVWKDLKNFLPFFFCHVYKYAESFFCIVYVCSSY